MVGGPSEVFASSRAAVCGMRPQGYERAKELQKAQKPISARHDAQKPIAAHLMSNKPTAARLKGQKLLAQGNALGIMAMGKAP